MTTAPVRYALVHNARSRREAEAYLPDNYRVIHETTAAREFRTDLVFIIRGEDVAGWTLDGYVIPRYGSGLITCEEVDHDHPALAAAGVTCECGAWPVAEYGARCPSCPTEPRLVDLLAKRVVASDEKVVLTDGRVVRFGSLTANDLAPEIVALRTKETS